MTLSIHTSIDRLPGPEVKFNCPQCHVIGAAGITYDQTERLGFFFFLPLCRLTNTFVKCQVCGRESISRLRTNELANLTPDELSHYLVPRVALVGRFLAMASALLAIVPFVGFGLALLALMVNWRSRGWPRVVSWIGAGVSCLITLVCALAMLSKHK